MVLIEIVLTILGLLSLGILGKQVGLINSFRADILNKLAFYVALPALIFNSVHKVSLGQIFSLNLTLGFWIGIFSTAALAFMFSRRISDNASRSVSIVQSFHGNTGYMGLPVVAVVLGEIAGGQASMILGLTSPVQITLTMVILASMNSANADYRQGLKRIFLNPVLIALLLGIIFSYFNIPVPSIPAGAISLLAELALPIALFGAGASIELKKPAGKFGMIVRALIFKLVAMPLIGLGIYSALGVEGTSLYVGLLMMAMPSAVSTYIYAREFSGDENLASLNISLTTLVSLVTISLIIFFISP